MIHEIGPERKFINVNKTELNRIRIFLRRNETDDA